jgi:hypothetical protein
VSNLYRIDSWLLDAIESVSRIIQRELGPDCFTQARCFLAAFLVTLVVQPFTWVNALVFALYAADLVRRPPVATEADEAVMNPERVRSAWRRLFLLAPCVMTLFLGMVSGLWLLTTYLYLWSCTPLPPCSGRMWDVIRSSRLVPARATE